MEAESAARKLALDSLTDRESKTLAIFDAHGEARFARDCSTEDLMDLTVLSAVHLVKRVRSGGETIFCPLSHLAPPSPRNHLCFVFGLPLMTGAPLPPSRGVRWTSEGDHGPFFEGREAA